MSPQLTPAAYAKEMKNTLTRMFHDVAPKNVSEKLLGETLQRLGEDLIAVAKNENRVPTNAEQRDFNRAYVDYLRVATGGPGPKSAAA